LFSFAFFSLLFEEQHGYSKTHDEYKEEKNQAGFKVCQADELDVRTGGYQVALYGDFKRCDYESFSEYFEAQK